MKKSVCTVIVNPISGRTKSKDEIVEKIRLLADHSGLTCVVKYTTGRGDATRFAASAVAERHKRVLVLGGDGTVNEAASALVNSDVILSIIPLGSGNGLSRTLGIPQNLSQAIERLFENRVAAIDVGRINDRYFFLITGLGFDADVAKSFDMFHRRGLFAYAYLGVREFFTYTPEKLKLRFSNQTLEVVPFIVAVANGQQYGNNALIAPKAKLDDGLLNLVIVKRFNLWHTVSQLYKLFIGKIDTFSEVDSYETNDLQIERTAPGAINLDGEACESDRVLNISVIPAALKVTIARETTAFVK